MAALAYTILQKTIVADQGKNSPLAQSLGNEGKEKLSIACYLAAIGLAFVNQWISAALYVLVAGIWLVPDRRIERIAVRS